MFVLWPFSFVCIDIHSHLEPKTDVRPGNISAQSVLLPFPRVLKLNHPKLISQLYGSPLGIEPTPFRFLRNALHAKIRSCCWLEIFLATSPFRSYSNSISIDITLGDRIPAHFYELWQVAKMPTPIMPIMIAWKHALKKDPKWSVCALYCLRNKTLWIHNAVYIALLVDTDIILKYY